MSASEPRLTSSEAGAAPPRPSAGGNGVKPGDNSVLVADSVEQALAAVQVQLARQAAIALAPVPETLPPPPALYVAPAPVPIREERPRRVTRPVEVDEDEGREADDEFWGETRPRREVAVDASTLNSAERRALGRLKARKVRRILRHVSPWSVFKVAIFFNLCLWLILMIAGVVLWKVAQQTPVLENIEKFYAKATGEKTFQLDGRAVFRAAAGAGVVLVLSGTAFVVLMSILFNLIADLTGGIRLSVIELESTRRPVRRRRGAEQVRSRAVPTPVGGTEGDRDPEGPVGSIDATGAVTTRHEPDSSEAVPSSELARKTAVPTRSLATALAGTTGGEPTAELKVLTRAGPDDGAGVDAV